MGATMDTISAYITNSFWYEKDSNSTEVSDPLLEENRSKQNSLFSTLGTNDSTSYFDSVDLSQTADFFTKLKALAQDDPEKFQALFQKLGETLKNAKGYAGQVLTNLAQEVADGADITDVII
ncbi:MAG: hypothetical protein ABFD81_13620 [Syntrophaceae bacterium]